MNRIFIALLVFFVAVSSAFGQFKTKELVSGRNDFKKVNLFDQNARASANIPSEIKSYKLVTFDKAKSAELLRNPNQAIELELPSNKRSPLKLKLVEIEFPEFSVTGAPNGEKIKYRKGKHYRGIVEGQPESIVALSVFDREIMGFVSEERSESIIAIGRVKDAEDTHIIYEESQVQFKDNFDCQVKDVINREYSREELFGNPNSGDRGLNDCVRLYFEVDNDIVSQMGQSGATNYISGIINQLAALYGDKAGINISPGAIVLWTSASPYNGGSASDMLTQFNNQRNGFDGDLGMLVSYKTNGGIAWIDGLCRTNKDYSSGFCRINSTFSNVPTYSWTINGLAHEFGHLFGSNHTHACVWNGNNTALDGCANTEGGCPKPGNTAFTIMSYCHLLGQPANFNNGFGDQPSSLMRSRVSAANCLSACGGGTNPPGGGGPSCNDGVKNGQETGVDCGGPTCPACPTCTDGIKNGTETGVDCGGSCSPCATCNDGIKNGQETGVDCGGPNCQPCQIQCNDNQITLRFNSDLYPQEFSWRIRNSSNQIIYSGSGYNLPLTTHLLSMCVPSACYTLEVNDAFGDGMCCTYGNGSYAILYNGNTLVSGGQFGSSETKQFCVNAQATSSCTDGIKNGQETGVDCGGPNCPACPTCNDGIKNGTETGVDCGGSCSPCSAPPSCTDGIKNGQETGVDCGGPICQACPTCNDGIKNGTETGIDCGGSCSPCPTCNDGIKNGNETGIDCGGSCSPCSVPASCTDGIKNGQETGVDCGGPTCQACPTCNDGIKNGTETGIDCGGSCSPCATCNDGVQNGQETGIDCGGPNCSPCNTNCITGTLTLVFDNYPQETKWEITNLSGQVLLSGNNYTSAGATRNIPVCLPSGGCYKLKMLDSFGDGMCCTYGNGSYKLVFNGTTLASGAQYGASETKDFCVNAGTPTSSCSDGIKNGQETGIDCGGPNCPACPTCTDGIKNGSETGVDCGGPNCPACPTCNDGIKNGQETGIDCGGSCSPCATCNDGIKNGQETGVDCGGPNCSPCSIPASCTDGIKNGTETGIDCGGPTCPACPTCTDGIKNGQETGVDCGGPTCAPCNNTCVTGALTLVFDNYPQETSWQITNLAGQVLLSGNSYTGQGSTKNISVCLPAGACYKLKMMDSFGDGMCCTYGNGSFKLVFNDSIVASGSQFTSSITKDFCVGSGTAPTPTCTDGVKNGSETGVDCGGPNCPACPTCTDGIKNGQETGVDCGGPSCPACPTCNDGIKNGSETGIDCGGPNCAPCNTSGVCVQAVLTVRTDNFPQETTWKLLNSAGQTLYSGGPYSVSSQNNNVNVCLFPSQCYSFVITDAYGDGMCCSYGNGNYKIVYNGNTLISGGQFGGTETKQFCMPAAGFESAGIEEAKTFNIYPNPVQDMLYIAVKDLGNDTEEISYEVFDLMGRKVKWGKMAMSQVMSLQTSELLQGTYMLRLSGSKEILYNAKFQVIK